MYFEVQKMNDTAIVGNYRNEVANSSFSFIKKVDVKDNDKKVYDCNHANHAVNIKNLLEHNKSYVQSTAANELYFIDMNRNAAQAYCNRGFAARNLQLFIQRYL